MTRAIYKKVKHVSCLQYDSILMIEIIFLIVFSEQFFSIVFCSLFVTLKFKRDKNTERKITVVVQNIRFAM